MAGSAFHPPIALMGPFDARTWSGATVFTVAAAPVALPTYGTGEGYFDDVLQFLNSYGSRGVAASLQHLGGLIDDAWTGGANAFTVTISAADRVVLTSDTIDFAITASTNLSQLGFTSSTYAAVGGGAPFIRTAETDWTRGVLQPMSITIDPAGAGAAYTVITRHVQSVPTLIRSAAEGDADGVSAAATGCLERHIQDDLTLPPYRAGLTDSTFAEGPGRVFISYAAAAAPAPAWSSATFAARLGFRGDEAEQSSGTTGWVVATYPCPGVLVSQRGLAGPIVPIPFEEGSTARQTNGVIASNKVGDFWKYEIAIEVPGPAYSGAPVATGEDLEKHLVHKVLKYMPRGEPLTLYQQWGDPRRRLITSDVTSTGSTVAYSTLYTSERNGDIGRLRMRRSGDDAAEHSIRYVGSLRNLAEFRIVGELRTSD